MRSTLWNLLLVVTVSLLLANPAASQPLLDDQFDDTDVTVNVNGIGSGWNPLVSNTVAGESGGVYSVEHLGGAQSHGVLSQDLFTPASATPTVLNVDYSSYTTGAGRWFTGWIDDTEPDVMDDGFSPATTTNHPYIKSGSHRGGLWVVFKAREDLFSPGGLVGDEGSLVYTIQDGPSFLLDQWTWDRSLFSFDEDGVAAGQRSDQIDMSLIADDLRYELTTDDTGWGLRFFTTDDSAILPADMSGTWAEAGVLAQDPTLSALGSARAVAYGAQSGTGTLVEVNRVYVDDEPQRNADDSGSLYTNDTTSSWANTNWEIGGSPVGTIPDVVVSSRSADAAQILNGGNVSVDTADQGAWTLDIDSGGAVTVASGRTLEIIENVSGSALNVDAGGELNIAGTVITPSIAGGGDVNFSNGTLQVVESGTIASAATSSDGTIANSRQLNVEQLTLGAGDTFNKQKAGNLVLDQAGGANSLAAGSFLNLQGGTTSAVNDAANNALDESAVIISGGSLTLSASAASPAAFDNAVIVNTNGTIRAAQAPGALSGQSVTLGGSNGIALSTGSTAVVDTADGYSLSVAGNVTGAGTFAVADGANVSLDGSITTSFLEIRGDSSNVSIGGTIAPTNSLTFVPTAASPNMTFSPDLSGNYEVVIDGGADGGIDGSVALAGSLSYTGATRIVRGALSLSSGGNLAGDFDSDGDVDGADFRLWQTNTGVGNLSDWLNNYGMTGGSGGNLPSASNVQFEGVPVVADGRRDAAVIMVGDAATALTIGAGAGEIQWLGSGGFAAAGAGTHTVTLDGGATLDWTSATSGFNGNQLQLGSAVATGKVELTNNINLQNGARVIELIDNQDSNEDSSEISGVISGGGSDGRLVVMGPDATHGGLLSLTGANTFEVLEIRQNTVHAEDGVGLPATALLQFNAQENAGPTLQPVATFGTSGTFSRTIGTGPGQVTWEVPNPTDTVPPVPDDVPTFGGGGFAAVGGDLTVTLNGGAEIDWFDASNGFNNKALHLGSNVGSGVTTFTNDGTTTGASNAHFVINNNPFDPDSKVVISGDYSDFNVLRFDGSGRVEFAGSGMFAGNMTVISRGYPPAADAFNFQELFITGDLSLGGGSGPFSTDLFVNGTFSVDNVLTGRSFNTIGGSGTIFMVDTDLDGAQAQRLQFQRDSRLQPGADYDTVGTLTVDFTLPDGSSDMQAGVLRFQDFFVYEMEFENNGGNVEHDSVYVQSLDDGDDATDKEIALIDFLQNNNNVENEEFFLELQALNDLTGLISASDEFELFTWNENIDFSIDNVVQDPDTSGSLDDRVFVSSDQFDVSGASVQWEVNSDFTGRMYVTGLSLLSPLSAAGIAVPEPSSCVVAALAVVGSLCYRRRDA